jgi:hypothetical protein
MSGISSIAAPHIVWMAKGELGSNTASQAFTHAVASQSPPAAKAPSRPIGSTDQILACWAVYASCRAPPTLNWPARLTQVTLGAGGTTKAIEFHPPWRYTDARDGHLGDLDIGESASERSL